MNQFYLEKGNPNELLGEVFIYSKYIGPNLKYLKPEAIPKDLDEMFPTKIKKDYSFMKYRDFNKIDDEFQSKLIFLEEIYERMNFRDQENNKYKNTSIILKPNTPLFLKEKDILYTGEYSSMELCDNSVNLGIKYYDIQFREQKYKNKNKKEKECMPEDLFNKNDLKEYYTLTLEEIAKISSKNVDFCLAWNEFIHELKKIDINPNELQDLENYIVQNNGNSKKEVLEKYAEIIVAFREEDYLRIKNNKEIIEKLI